MVLVLVRLHLLGHRSVVKVLEVMVSVIHSDHFLRSATNKVLVIGIRQSQ